MVENAGAQRRASADAQNDEIRVGVRQILRYGVQIITTVPGPANHELRVIDVALVENRSGGHSVQLDLENTGTRFVRPDCWIEVFDADGATLGRTHGCGARVLPGGFDRSRIDLSHLPSGSYQALLVLDTGGSDITGTQYILEL